MQAQLLPKLNQDESKVKLVFGRMHACNSKSGWYE